MYACARYMWRLTFRCGDEGLTFRYVGVGHTFRYVGEGHTFRYVDQGLTLWSGAEEFTFQYVLTAYM